MLANQAEADLAVPGCRHPVRTGLQDGRHGFEDVRVIVRDDDVRLIEVAADGSQQDVRRRRLLQVVLDVHRPSSLELVAAIGGILQNRG